MVLHINKNKVYRRNHGKSGSIYTETKSYLVFKKNDYRVVSTNPTLVIKFFSYFTGTILVFHFLILCKKPSIESLSFISCGIKFQIIGRKCRSESEPLQTVLTWEMGKSGCKRKL